MRARHWLSLLFVVSCALGEFVFSESALPLQSVSVYTRNSEYDSYQISKQQLYHYNSRNLLDSVTGSNDSIQVKCVYDDNGVLLSTQTLSGDHTKGQTEVVYIKSRSLSGKIVEKSVVRNIWEDTNLYKDSSFVVLQYDELGRVVIEDLSTINQYSSKSEKLLNPEYKRVAYSYNGDQLDRIVTSHCKGEFLSDEKAFSVTGITKVVPLTSLSGEKIVMKEHFAVSKTDTVPESRVTIVKDENGVVQSEKFEQYDLESKSYIVTSRTGYSYHQGSVLKSKEVKKHTDDGLLFTKYEYKYRGGTSVAETPVTMPQKMVVTAKSSVLTFDLTNRGSVTLNLYSIDGRKVMTVFNGRELSSGSYTLDLKPIAQFQNVAAGLYIYQLEAMGKQFSGKVAL